MSEDTQEQELSDAALEKINQAIREFAQLRENTDEGRQIFVTASVIMYEKTWIDKEGDNVYQVEYSFPESTSLSAAMGVVTLGTNIVKNDLMEPIYGDSD